MSLNKPNSSPVLSRVLFLAQRDEYGEFARYTADLAKAWQRATIPTVWIEADAPSVDFGDIPTETIARFNSFGAAKLARKMRSLNPQVVVSVGARAGQVGASAARQAGVKQTVHVALSDLIYTDYNLRRVIQNYLRLRSIIRHTDRLVFPTYGNRYQLLLRGWAPEKKMYLLPATFDSRECPPDAKIAELKQIDAIPASTCRVVYAGPLRERARLDWLLRAWSLVETSQRDAHLTIVGTGPCERALRNQASCLNLKRCQVIQPQRSFIEYVAVADIVAITSLYETHTRLPLAAMGCKKPIVAMNSDGIREALRNGKDAQLVEVGDVSRFASALMELIQNPQRRSELAQAGRDRITHFGPEAFQRDALRLLASLTGTGGAP